MPNYEGNTNISEYGEATRFGAGNCPLRAQQKASKPWAIRNALRRIACSQFETGLRSDFFDFISVFMANGRQPTGAEFAAAMMFHHAMNDCKAMDKLIDRIDGKQTEKKAEADISLADLVNGAF